MWAIAKKKGREEERKEKLPKINFLQEHLFSSFSLSCVRASVALIYCVVVSHEKAAERNPPEDIFSLLSHAAL